MGKPSSSAKFALGVIAFLVVVLPVAARGQDKGADTKGTSESEPRNVKLTIAVTGGEEKKPVENASVYVKYAEERKLRKDKKIEMNLKTNQQGICHVPVIPPGKFLVQVIAEGWKTYGEYYDVSEPDQTINIALVRPPKWY